MSARHLLKLMRNGVISGYVVRDDSSPKLFVPDLNNIPAVHAMFGNVDVEVGRFELMSMPVESGNYARGWCITQQCRCSPPIGGYTCHHCASVDNRNSTGSSGYIFALPYNIDVDGNVTVVKDYPFVGRGFRTFLQALFCRVFDIPSICSNVGVNRFDFAKLDYSEVPPDLGRYSAVIFAGINRGPYAIAYPLSNVPEEYRPDNLVHPSQASSLEAYVIHCDTWGDQWRCPTIRRRYRYYGSGAITVYAYGTYYTFANVAFLTATDVPLRVECCGDTKTITWAVQPGYSGGVVFERAST